ncbi:uncharacterized protein LOC143914240 [Arctopsyche grandis]|uniref:uncharacterized protein LOC143914240 n=1 Tax=Arctopsyche grandis TaxID=121162 RepID=UPI00406D8638
MVFKLSVFFLLIVFLADSIPAAAKSNESFLQMLFNAKSTTSSSTSSILYYNPTTRRFHFNNHVEEFTPRSKKKSRGTMTFIDVIIDFFTGGFFSDFLPSDRKPPKISKNEKATRPHREEDYNEPIDTYFDSVDDLFGNTDSSEESSEDTSSSWFSWFRTKETTSENPMPTVVESTSFEDEIMTEKPPLDEVTAITNTTQELIIEKTTLKPNTSTITSALQRPTTMSYSQFMNKNKNKSGRKTTTTTPVPIRIQHRRPNNVSRQNITKSNKDCNEKKPSSWFPQMFGITNSIDPITPNSIVETTTKAPEGWFSFLTNLDKDDESETTESSLGWFNNLFNSASSTKSSTTPTPITFPTSTVSADTNWFDSFLNVEEDDAAYSLQNKTEPSKRGKRKTYHGFQLLRIRPNNIGKVKKLKSLREDTQGSGLMWWSSPTLNRSADLLVPQDLIADVRDHLNGEDIEYDVMIWDLQKAIAYENPKLSKTQRLELESTRGHPLTWRRYHRYADMLRYMEYLSLKYPEMVELIPLGRSSQGMPLIVAKAFLKKNETENTKGPKKKWKLRSKMKPAIWIDGGTHAREWISPAVATWILHSLIEGEHGDGENLEMLQIADWYIMPVVNPDGYEHTHTRDRLWRKTRSKLANSDTYFNGWFPWNWGNTECMGVDLNRNWDYHWGEKGSSNDPCNDYYAGPFPFSEPETKAVSEFLMENKDQMKVFLSLHSYSQIWLMPSSHSRDSFADQSEMLEMGKLALKALSESSGSKYEIGSMTEFLQPITGTAHDWAKGRAGIKYSYAIKLRDSNGPHGYLLPGSQITPTAKETWEAIKAIADNI